MTDCAPNACGCEQPPRTQAAKALEPEDKTLRTTLTIADMDCPTEEQLVRTTLARVAGVGALEFNLMQRTLTVTHVPAAWPSILSALQTLDMTITVHRDTAPAKSSTQPTQTEWWRLVVSGVVATAAEIVHVIYPGHDLIVAALAATAIALSGLPTYKKGWIALKNRNLNINALMSIAVTGALLIGQWPEAAMVMFLFALAEVIEAKSIDRARRAIHGLLALAPETATVRQTDGTWQDVPAGMVPIEAVVRVKPGERIALDGVVVSGRTTVNQAPITGESLPVDKGENDAVFAGTLNESGSFEYRVTAAANDSTLARIIHTVEQAQGARAPTQRFVDQFARIYTPVVFAVALGMAVIPPVAVGMAWFDAIYQALVLLVIACPCALVISTPVTIVSGLAAATRHGILIKGGVYLEAGRKLVALAFDKTGTLTYGKPSQTDFIAIADDDTRRLQSLAASLATRSDHPVSQAIARAAAEAEVVIREVEEVAAIPGRGVGGRIEGQTYRLGNHALMAELGLCPPGLEGTLDTLERQGKTVVLLANEQAVLALFAVADTVRESSRQAIAELHALGVKTVMLSGDNPHTVAAIAQAVGVDDARGNLLPADKVAAIEALLTPAGKIGMAGDGINDAPALARADIGFAMGAAGSDTAIETADVALMDDDLRKLPRFIRLSRASAAVLAENIALALGIKAIFIILTFMGEATMWMAVFADMGASLLVVGNGLRLLKQ